MKFRDKNFKLKNGKEILVRQAKIQDAENLIQVVKSYISDSGHILLTDKEFNPTITQEEKWIQSFIDAPNSLLLVAIYDNKIIGNIDLTASKREKLNHTAIVGLGIIKEWQGAGVGTVLLESVIDWSKKNSTLIKIWLEVFANNQSGIALYKKVGFKEDGRQSKFIKTAENQFVDNIFMSLDIRQNVNLNL